MRARDRSYAAGGGCLGAADSPEFDALKFPLEDCRGLSVLDAGCGVGKFSPLVKRAEYLLGVDFSCMALGSWRGYWDRFWRNRPLSLKYGKYPLAMYSPKSPPNLVKESSHSAHSK